MPILEVHHIEKHFGATRVLEDISFDLEQGQALAIIGSSGSGKTTLLRCLNFLETPTRGRSSSRGTLCSTPTIPPPSGRARCGKSGSISAWCSSPSTCSPVHRPAGTSPWPRAPQPGTARLQSQLEADPGGDPGRGPELLAKMGLSDRADHYPSQLSGGQQQRVAIARALALHPDILCFDEPTSALDPELTGEVLKVIRSLAEQKTTMIIVTHEMAFARDVADQVIFMDGGVIVEQGPAHQVIEHPSQERTGSSSWYAES